MEFDINKLLETFLNQEGFTVLKWTLFSSMVFFLSSWFITRESSTNVLRYISKYVEKLLIKQKSYSKEILKREPVRAKLARLLEIGFFYYIGVVMFFFSGFVLWLVMGFGSSNLQSSAQYQTTFFIALCAIIGAISFRRGDLLRLNIID